MSLRDRTPKAASGSGKTEERREVASLVGGTDEEGTEEGSESESESGSEEE